jgi:tRNA threonylcarbamoyladenosine biosynthesis protein TsaB
MRFILAIDTSTERGRVAAVEGGGSRPRTVAELDETMPGSHTAHLMSLIDRVLGAAGWPKDRIDGVAVVRGPGRFTGVRIALGTGEGLALAGGCPCVGVHTLEAMAEASGPCAGERVCVLGAGRGELYLARFDDASTPPLELQPPGLVEAAEFWGNPPGYVLWGAGASPPRPLSERLGRPAGSGTAAAAARIALSRGAGDPMSTPTPLYVRPSDAEIQRRRR